MDISTETQAFLGEIEEPSIVSIDACLDAFLQFVPVLGSIGEQHDKVARLLRMAQITESDASVLGLCERAIQTYGALLRQRQDLDRCVGQFIAVLRQAKEVNSEVQAALTPAASE